jgi:peptidoglycan/xylan/chitin deacetylase (PgdA/CDA1 family)
MTMHPYFGDLIDRERRREMMAAADRLRRLSDLPRAGRPGAFRRGAGTRRRAVRVRLQPRYRAARW